MSKHIECRCKWCLRAEAARHAFLCTFGITVLANAIFNMTLGAVLIVPGVFLLTYALTRREQIKKTVQSGSDNDRICND